VTTAFAPSSSRIGQNTWIQTNGANLVPATTAAAGVTWSAAPEFALNQMPTTLGGVSVSINNKPAYLYSFAAPKPAASAHRIRSTCFRRRTTLGTVPVVVTNNGASTPSFSVTMHAAVPALFNFDGNHVVARHLDSTLVGPTTLYPGFSTPATPGETVSVVGSGFGIPKSKK
jgi:uncharacterized protein (TIGR03437 family)